MEKRLILYLTFPSDEPFAFSIEFQIHCGNIPDPIDGKIHVKTKKEASK
jgi:hypothetical protein